jgi:hypothetical protein
MSWQAKIFNKYRLFEKGVKIISDFTGLLVHPEFLNFLSQENKPVAIVNSAPEILEKQNVSDNLIIGYKINVPAFIRNKNEVIVFNCSSIPLNGNTQLLSGYSTDEIIELLNFLEETQPHAVISEQLLNEVMPLVRKRIQINKLNTLTSNIHQLIQEQVSLENIFKIAGVWAELQYKSYQLNHHDYFKITKEIDNHCNLYFENGNWQEAFFAPASNPKTVDKLIHKIKQDQFQKKALLVFDCMGLPEWLLLKDFLKEENYTFEETQVFSLLPSITSIARSAIFTGTYNVYNKKNPGQSAEEKDLKLFFGEKDTVYLREKDYTGSDSFIGYNTVSILFNFFDDLSHAAQIQDSNLTKFGYYNSVVDYLKNSRVKQIVTDLIHQDFVIYICSDHGSTIAKGNGKNIDKYLHDKFAKRGTIISKDSSILTEHQKIRIPFIVDKLVVIPENREMFAEKNKYEINHGGISIDEMVVPFVKLVKQ